MNNDILQRRITSYNDRQAQNTKIVNKTGDVNENFRTDCIRGIRNEGMPIVDSPGAGGVLFIKFKIEFPEDNFLKDESDYKVLFCFNFL